ncbi:MAG TPA: UDP-3-O-(3-hydroxymyristoyl)glucosamine N-acyltransferase [Rhizomicrobium sp.]|jgi:UDP-3-O-[3-hydroxymyristoyl] glucosamine N-acyltransferase
MADSRFYDNRGPFTLAGICARAGIAPPDDDDGSEIADVATLEGASAAHLTFCTAKDPASALAASQAGFCLVAEGTVRAPGQRTPRLLGCRSVQHAFAAVAQLFYPEPDCAFSAQECAIHPSALIDDSVRLAPGVVIGPNVEIGGGTRIGANTVIGRGVAIGRDCEIANHVGISHAYLGDRVSVLPGAQIGQAGFGFAGSDRGHARIPQLGRVIVQDAVEIGSCTTIDRGALGDTVIGEGTKIDNLVQIGHNSRIGRHCMIVAQVGISGSCELGDFVVLGGQVGIADHVRIGDGARFAARGAATPGVYPGGEDYGGVPARPMRQWRREVAAVARLAKRGRQNRNG